MRHLFQSNRGVSLIEATIVLTAMSILTAAMTPVAKRTLDQARLSRVVTDEAAIKTAVTNFLTDTGFIGFFDDGVSGAAADVDTVDMLVSDGDIPSCTGGPNQGCAVAPLWSATVTGIAVDFLERHLVTNNPGANAANDYPVSGVLYWKGAYINAPVDPDPWGSRYMVNTRWFAINSVCGAPSRANDVFVLSAGPDQAIDTAFRFDDVAGVVGACTAGTAATKSATPGDDDVMTIIRRDAAGTTP